MRVVDLRDEGASPYLDEAPKKAPPTKPKAPRKRPGQQNPVTLAQYFANRARVHQWGHASPATIRELAGTFRRWRDEHGVSYREMATATDLFFEEFPADCEAPAGRVFIKQGFQWIAAAKGTIWDEELPKLQALNEQMWDEIYAEYDPLVAAHPEWSELERDALLSKLYNEKRDLPAYAACYA